MADAVHLKILFFAKSRELSGHQESVLELSESKISYSDLLDHICSKFNLTIIKVNLILALNGDYCDSAVALELKNGDEIAVIPPISGG